MVVYFFEKSPLNDVTLQKINQRREENGEWTLCYIWQTQNEKP